VLRLRRAEGPGISQGLEVDAVRDAETLHDLMNEGLNLGDRHIVLNVHKWVSAAAKLAAALDRLRRSHLIRDRSGPTESCRPRCLKRTIGMAPNKGHQAAAKLSPKAVVRVRTALGQLTGPIFNIS
jgi:hypothetical protein